MIPLCNNNSVTNQISAQLLNRTDWLLSAQQAYFLSDSCEVWNHLEQFEQSSQNIFYHFMSEQDIQFLSVKLEISSELQDLTEFVIF